MIYVFANDEGETVEVDLPMSKAPKFGAKRTINGKVYWRSIQHEKGRVRAQVKKDIITTYQFSPWTPGADSYDEQGNARFETRGSAKRFAERHGVQYDPEGWDPCPSERTMRQMFDERRNAGRLTEADLQRIAHG